MRLGGTEQGLDRGRGWGTVRRERAGGTVCSAELSRVVGPRQGAWAESWKACLGQLTAALIGLVCGEGAVRRGGRRGEGAGGAPGRGIARGGGAGGGGSRGRSPAGGAAQGPTTKSASFIRFCTPTVLLNNTTKPT